MRHNLKNFPPLTKGSNLVMQGTIDRVWTWKKFFIEELQQRKQDTPKLGDWIRRNSDVKTTGELLRRFIDEMLGEEK